MMEKDLSQAPVESIVSNNKIEVNRDHSSSKLILMVYPPEFPIPSGIGAILITLRAASRTESSITGLPLGFDREKSLIVPSRWMVILRIVEKS